MVINYSIHEVNYVIDKWVELVAVCNVDVSPDDGEFYASKGT